MIPGLVSSTRPPTAGYAAAEQLLRKKLRAQLTPTMGSRSAAGASAGTTGALGATGSIRA